MKKVSVLFFLCYLHLSCIDVTGQVKVAAFDEFPEFKGIGLAGYLSIYAADSCTCFYNVCERTCLFIKFKISVDGEVIKMAGNSDASAVFVEAFKRALLSTTHRWSPHMVNGIAVESPYFVLPIYIHLQACNDELPKVDTIFKSFTGSHNYDDGTDLENEVCIFLKPAMIVTLH